MTDEELNLLKQLFESAGAIGSQGFEAMVRYTFADGLTWMLGGAIGLLLSIGVFMVGAMKDNIDDDARGVMCLGSFMLAVIATLVILSHITSVVEPAGATVESLLDKATR